MDSLNHRESTQYSEYFDWITLLPESPNRCSRRESKDVIQLSSKTPSTKTVIFTFQSIGAAGLTSMSWSLFT